MYKDMRDRLRSVWIDIRGMKFFGGSPRDGFFLIAVLRYHFIIFATFLG